MAGPLGLPSPCPSPWLQASFPFENRAGALGSERLQGGCEAIVGQAAPAGCPGTGEVDLRNVGVAVRQGLLEWPPPPSLQLAGRTAWRGSQAGR